MLPKKLIGKIRRRFFPTDAVLKIDVFLKSVSGVIHVGANTGQERDLYAKYHLDVVWI